MKALILVGGYGTRLRPLTFTMPKPLVPFANKAIVMHQIEALVGVGVSEVVLAVSYQAEILVDALKTECAALGLDVVITVSKEEIPLGTAGPLGLARAILGSTDGAPFFVFNSDVSCTFPLQQLLDCHLAHGGEGTILVTRVEDPSKYGVVVYDETTGLIDRFVEKPTEFVGDKINAGMYIFNPAILDRIKPVPTSIEREVFPVMTKENKLYAMELPGFWMDIGQPKDYLSGQTLYLQDLSLKEIGLTGSSNGSEITGNVMIHETAKIGNGCRIGPDVVIGKGVTIGDGVRLRRCTLFDDVVVESSALVDTSIVGWNCTIGSWARLQDNCVLGDDVHVAAETVLCNVQVLPHKKVRDSSFVPRIIM